MSAKKRVVVLGYPLRYVGTLRGGWGWHGRIGRAQVRLIESEGGGWHGLVDVGGLSATSEPPGAWGVDSLYQAARRLTAALRGLGVKEARRAR